MRRGAGPAGQGAGARPARPRRLAEHPERRPGSAGAPVEPVRTRPTRRRLACHAGSRRGVLTPPPADRPRPRDRVRGRAGFHPWPARVASNRSAGRREGRPRRDQGSACRICREHPSRSQDSPDTWRSSASFPRRRTPRTRREHADQSRVEIGVPRGATTRRGASRRGRRALADLAAPLDAKRREPRGDEHPDADVAHAMLGPDDADDLIRTLRTRANLSARRRGERAMDARAITRALSRRPWDRRGIARCPWVRDAIASRP